MHSSHRANSTWSVNGRPPPFGRHEVCPAKPIHNSTFLYPASRRNAPSSSDAEVKEPNNTSWGASLASRTNRTRRQPRQQQRLETVEPTAVADIPEDGAASSGNVGTVVVVQPVDQLDTSSTASRRSGPRTQQRPSPGEAQADQNKTPPRELQQPQRSSRTPPITFSGPAESGGLSARAPPRESAPAARPQSMMSQPPGLPPTAGRAGIRPQSPSATPPSPPSKQPAANRPSAATASAATQPPTPAPPAAGPQPRPPRSAAAEPAAPESTSAAAQQAPSRGSADSAASAATATKPQGAKPARDGDVPLEISFAQVMGRGSKRRGKAGEGEDAGKPQDADVVDYTWEPDPELDRMEDELAKEKAEKAAAEKAGLDREARRRRLEDAAEAGLRAAYEPGGPPPPEFVGPLSVRFIAGRGFGLVAEESVAAGQLLLVSSPLLLARGLAGEMPQVRPLVAEALRLLRVADGVESSAASPEQPTPHQPTHQPQSAPSSSETASTTAASAAAEAAEAAEAADARALATLFSGKPRTAAEGPPADLAAWRGRAESLLGREGSGARARREARARMVASRPLGHVGDWPPERVMSLLQLNMMVEATQDGVVAAARGEPLESLAGVWPEVALANHSCAPNATAVLLQDRIVVRAARPIPSGREVLLNWLGPTGLFQPMKRRRRELARSYGFNCRCARCELEAREALSVPFIFKDAERESELPLQLMAQALEERDLAALLAALPPLRDAVGRLGEAVTSLGRQVDLTGGRESSMALATVSKLQPSKTISVGEEQADGTSGGDGDGVAAAAAAAAGVAGALGRVKKGAKGAKGAKAREGKGKAKAKAEGVEVTTVDRPTLESWLVGGMLPLHEALIDGLAMRAAWLGADLGPGWHWPTPEPICVPTATASEEGQGAEEDRQQQQRAPAGAVTQRKRGERQEGSEREEVAADAGPSASLAASDGSSAGSDSRVVQVDEAELGEAQAQAVAELMAALAAYVDIITLFLPGSEAHVRALTRLLALASSSLGPHDAVTSGLQQAAFEAYSLRYGKQSAESFDRLMASAVEAMDEAKRFEAAAANRSEVGAAEAEEDGSPGLDDLFAEDARIRQQTAEAEVEAAAALAAAATADARARARAAAEAAAAAAAAAAGPRSWPLMSESGAGEREEELQLPEGVVALETSAARVLGRGLDDEDTNAGSSSSWRAAEEEAERELMQLMGKARDPRGASGSVSPAAAAAEAAVTSGANAEEAAALARLFARDSGAASGLEDDDDIVGSSSGEQEEMEGVAATAGRRGGRRPAAAQRDAAGAIRGGRRTPAAGTGGGPASGARAAGPSGSSRQQPAASSPEVDDLLDVFPGL